MFGFSHIFDILGLCFIALLVFGPKRMIEMGSSLGKALRELRDAAKEMNWTSVLHEDGAATPGDTYTAPRQPPTNGAASGGRAAHTPGASAAPTVVEGTLEDQPEE